VSLRSAVKPLSRPLILPGYVGLGDDLLAQSRRDRRIVSAAVIVGVLTCAALISTRTTPEPSAMPFVQQQPPITKLPEQVGLGVYPIAASVNPRTPPATQPAPARAMAAAVPTVSPAVTRFASALPTLRRTARATTSTIAAAVARVDSAGAHSAAPRQRTATDVVLPDTIAPIAVMVVSQFGTGGSPALRVTAPRPTIARTPVTALAIAAPADVDSLSSGELRSSVSKFVSSLRARAATNADLMEFYADGAEHRATLVLVPSAEFPAAASTRVSFDIRLSKYDAVGRVLTRILPVEMLVAKRNGEVRTSAVTFGSLRKP
jgi:hypothetical protein